MENASESHGKLWKSTGNWKLLKSGDSVRSVMVDEMLKSTEIIVEIVIFSILTLVALIIILIFINSCSQRLNLSD